MTFIHLSLGGKNRRIVDKKGKIWMFEDHPHIGPVVLNKNGDPSKKQPSVKSPFWDCVELWYKHGKEIDSNGVCDYSVIKK